MKEIINSKLLRKLFVLAVLCLGVCFVGFDNTMNQRVAAMENFGCYNDLQVCANNCASQPDPWACNNTNCLPLYEDCVWALPVFDLNQCLNECPNCGLGGDDYCWQARQICKTNCIERAP